MDGPLAGAPEGTHRRFAAGPDAGRVRPVGACCQHLPKSAFSPAEAPPRCPREEVRCAPRVRRRLWRSPFRSPPCGPRRPAPRSRRGSRSTPRGRRRCRTSGSWARPRASRSMRRTMSGSSSGRDSHRRREGASLDPPRTKCCVPAPPVIEFDQDGNLVQAWGGPGQGYDWPQNEHGIHIDPKGFVWLGGNGETDGQILKFTRDGKFVLQIGKHGPQTNSNDTTRLGRPAERDGRSRRPTRSMSPTATSITASSCSTPTPARSSAMWGAYGKPPTDEKLPPYDPAAPPAQQFRNPVHCVRSPGTGSSTSATGPTTASRCSARTARS